MEFEPTGLPEVILIKPRVFGAARGFFLETCHERKFAAARIEAGFIGPPRTYSIARHRWRSWGLAQSPWRTHLRSTLAHLAEA